jgi:sulfur carrier protein
MRIVVNGEQKNVGGAITVTQLLGELGLVDRRVAVEVNLEIVPRSLHAQHRLREDDRVEVVVAVGGG